MDPTYRKAFGCLPGLPLSPLEREAHGAEGGVIMERFWSRVAKMESGCWIWQGSKTPKGHGSMWLNGRTRGAHRISWEIANGPIPAGLLVCHDCPGGDNPSCVNPAHLFLGTEQDNARDAMAKGLRRTSSLPDRQLRTRCTCNKCGKVWLSNNPNPATCANPKCRSARWNRKEAASGPSKKVA